MGKPPVAGCGRLRYCDRRRIATRAGFGRPIFSAVGSESLAHNTEHKSEG